MKFTKILTLTLSFIMIFCLCACASDKETVIEDNQSKIEVLKEQIPKFKVTVTDNEGNAVEGVILQIKKEIRTTARTDINGVANFNVFINDADYKLFVMSCPEGYEYTGAPYIYLKPYSTEYTLEINKK